MASSRDHAVLEPRASLTLDDYVVSAAWAPDGSALAVVGGEGRVFRIALDGLDRRGTRLNAVAAGSHAIGGLAAAWSPAGDAFATSGQDNSVVIRDALSGAARATFRPGMAWSEHLAYSPDGAQLAVASGKGLSLWSRDGTLLQRFAAQTGSIAALAWDRAGRELGAALNGGMLIARSAGNGKGADTAEGFVTRQLKWPGQCLTVAWSPNGRVLASGVGDGSVHFWYLGTARDSQMRGYPGRVNLTSWSGNSRYLATNAANDVVAWDFGGRGPEGSKPIVLRGHTEAIDCLAFQPGGSYLVSAGRDWRLSLWLPGKAGMALDAHLTDAEASCLCWSPDGNYVAVGERKGKLTVFALSRSG